MSEPCISCGDTRLVTVRIPGHEHVEAILCLTCSTVQTTPPVAALPPTRR